MKQSDKIKVEMSKARERLAELSAKDQPSDEEKTEMRSVTDGYKDLETRYQAAVTSESEEDAKAAASGDVVPDGEAKELFGLVTRASVGRYLERAASGRPLDGVEADLNQGLELAGGDRMPLALLLPQASENRSETEDRADAAISLSVNTLQRPEAWLPRIFEGTATSHIGVTRKSVSGLAAFPVIGSGVTAKTVGKADAKDAEALGLTVETLDPKRISARYLFSKEDAARLGPAMFEDALRSDMRMSLATQMDDEIINGDDDNSATLIEGILEAVTPKTITGATDAAISDASTGKEVAQGILGEIEGKFAMQSGDLKYIANAQLYSHFKTLPLAIGSTDHIFLESWLSHAEKIMGMGSAHIGEITGQVGESYIIISRARGLTGAACHAVWDSVEIIRDPYTNASTGQVALTLCALHNFKVLRDDNYLVRRVART